LKRLARWRGKFVVVPGYAKNFIRTVKTSKKGFRMCPIEALARSTSDLDKSAAKLGLSPGLRASIICASDGWASFKGAELRAGMLRVLGLKDPE
jgi:hypothetical protein